MIARPLPVVGSRASLLGAATLALFALLVLAAPSADASEAKLIPADGAAANRFGYSVSVSGDTAIIGSPLSDDVGTNSGSAYVYTRSGTTWNQQAKLVPIDSAADDWFGYSVSVSGDTAIIGSYRDDEVGTNSGSAYIYTRSGTTWTQQAKLVPADGAAVDLFGYSVSVDGDTVMIGSLLDDDMGADSGSTYVYTRSGTTWAQQAKLVPTDGAGGDFFGHSVSLSAETAIIGSPQDDDSGADSGSAYVYTRSGTTWNQQAKLVPTDNAADDQFGYSVSVSFDNAIVGSPFDDDKGTDSGSAYVYTRSGTTWTQQAKLGPTGITSQDDFGHSVSVNFENTIIGSPFDDDNGSNSGSAYADTRPGTTWTQQAKLVAIDGAADDKFGHSVSVSGDTAIIGSYQDHDQGFFSGSAYVYTRSGTTWIQQAKLTASDGAQDDNFGWAVSVSGDTAIVGSYHDDHHGESSGSAYVFTRSGTTWTQQAKLVPADGGANDNFGVSVSVDGDTAVIGSWRDDDAGTNSGSAYVYTRSGTTWTQQGKLAPADGAAGDLFGFSVSVSDDTAIIGSYADDDMGSASGSAYVYTRSGNTWTQQAKLVPSDGGASDLFGASVAVSGNTAVIGSNGDDDQGGSSGSAYVYTRSGTTWTQQAKLLPTDGAASDFFGHSVAVSGDTAVVASYFDDDNGSNSGSAYVFKRSATTWSQQAKLVAADGARDDLFGFSVSVSDGTAIIGTPFDDDNGVDSGSGYMYLADTTPPVFSDRSDMTAEATGPDGAFVTYIMPIATDVVSGPRPVACTPGSGTTFPLGATAVMCTASDAAGNEADPTSFNVTVQDTTAPVISAANDTTAEATSADGATVTYSAPTWTDAVDGTGTATCSPESGTAFPLGTTTVTCTAADAAGNEADPNSFNVTVQDTTPPLVDSVPDQTQEATGPDGAMATYAAPTWTDAVDGTGTATCSPESGSTFPLGASTITCAATDAAGNTGTSTFKVTVVDTTPPEIEEHPDLVFLASEPGAGLITYEAPATFDIVDEAGQASCDPPNGTVLPLGEWTVTCTATDAAGNAAVPTTFTVTVTDQIDVVLELDNEGQVPLDAIAYGADITASVLGQRPVEEAAVTVTITHAITGEPVRTMTVELVTDENGAARLEIPLDYTLPGTYTIEVEVAWGHSAGDASGAYTRIAL